MLQKKTLSLREKDRYSSGRSVGKRRRGAGEEGGEATVSKSENKRGELAGDLDGRTGGGQRVSGGGMVRGAERQK